MLTHLNSATKYPSIPTYHALGDRGRLTEERNVVFDGPVNVSEKIDGVNARIILPPWGQRGGNPILGSREELLHYVGDLIYNPSEGIVDTILPVLTLPPETLPGTEMQQRRALGQESSNIIVIYGEVYGGTTTTRKQYTCAGVPGFRVFDIAIIDPDVLDWPIEKISSWRQHGGQQFLNYASMVELATDALLSVVPQLAASAPPVGVADTSAWLGRTISHSYAVLDDGAVGRPEGLVVRSEDRSKIAKIRFEDYNRTLTPPVPTKKRGSSGKSEQG
jgi:RNA ligase